MIAEEWRLPVLVSFAYALTPSEEAVTLSYVRDPRLSVLIDSGAFTAKFSPTKAGKVSLETYCAFLERGAKEADGYVQFDVVGDHEATMANLASMLERGLKPLPVHVIGAPLDAMDDLFAANEWVCLAGMQKRPGVDQKAYLDWKMSAVGDRKVHWLGFTKQEQLLRHKPYSADCSSWNSGSRYGAQYVYHGNGVLKAYKLRDHLHRQRLFLDPVWRATITEYGYSVHDQLVRKKWGLDGASSNMELMIQQISTEAWVRYVLDMYQQHGIRVYLASIPKQVPFLIEAYERVLAKKGVAA